MKQLIYLLSIFLAVFLACSKDHDPFVISDCMTQKIEDFKSDTNALEVIQINAPDRKLFWFRLAHIPVDVGEDIFDNDCDFYCNFGCFCLPSFQCDEALLNYPRTTLWMK